jgi:hypothetical protein
LAFGAPKELVDELRAESERAQTFKVLKENWQTIQIFSRLATQWVWGSMGGCVGLNYQSVKYLLKLNEVSKKDRKKVFKDIQLMEFAALEVLNGKAK